MPCKKSYTPWYQRPLHDRDKFAFMEAQWADIRKLSGLPDIARKQIENCVIQYYFWKGQSEGAPPPADTRQKVKDIKQAVDHLSALLDDPGHDVLAALLESAGTSGTMPRKMAYELLRDKVEALQGLSDWLQKADSSIPTKKPGPDTGDFDWLVKQLDTILHQHTRKRINRSNNKNSGTDYVMAVMKAADTSIGEGTVQFAIRRLVSSRRKHRRKS